MHRMTMRQRGSAVVGEAAEIDGNWPKIPHQKECHAP
jgi:hypothetical protein